MIAHPNTYLPLSGYMVFGDTLLVTGNGCVTLNQTEKKLFAKNCGGGPRSARAIARSLNTRPPPE